MTKPDSIALVVPCYNEAKRFSAEVFRSFLDVHPNVSFLFVDDGSTDETLIKLTEFCNSLSKQSRVIALEGNSGKAEAVRQGILQVVDEDHEYIGYWDADLSTPLNEVDNLLLSLKRSNADAAFGSRVKILGHDIDRRLYRHLAGRVFATIASYTLGLPVYDTQCGAKLFVNNRSMKAVFNDPFVSGWSFDVEILRRYSILYQATEARMNIREVPLACWTHIAGSKVKASDFFYAIYELYRIKSYYRRKHVIGHYYQLIGRTY